MDNFKPNQQFIFPGGKPMCPTGQITAAYLGHRILSGEITPEEADIEARATFCKTEEGKSDEMCTIYHVVATLSKRNVLDHYVTPDGDFLLNGNITNIKKPEYSFYTDVLEQQNRQRRK